MKEYIEKAALKERFQKRLIWLKKDVHDEYSKGLYHGCETDMGLIDEILAADVVEVRHGRWTPEIHHTYLPVEYDDAGGPILHEYISYRCSLCGREEAKEELYCHCGARMDKEDEHEAG